MITVNTTATVNYVCRIDGEQEKMVNEYAKRKNLSMLEAVRELYFDTDFEFDLYSESNESDFCTESIDSVEVDDWEEEFE